MTTDTADKFWLAFRDEAGSLERAIAKGDLRAAFDRVDALMQVHGFDFSFDMTQSEDGEPILILTPEGDPGVARQIDEVLARRPQIPGWRFVGRRQQKPLEDAYVFVRHAHEIDVGDATFDLNEHPDGYEITMHSTAFRGLADEESWGAAATFLDHAVGEEVVMSRVRAIKTADRGGGLLTPAQLVARVTGS